jgi:alkaline phosphatase D
MTTDSASTDSSVPVNRSPALGGFTRRQFVETALALGVSLTATNLALGAPEPGAQVLGPILGHTDEASSLVWMRSPAAGKFTLEIKPISGGPARVYETEAKPENDFCMCWKVEDLQPSSAYRYQINAGDKTIADAPEQIIKTAPSVSRPAKVRIAVSSCAREDAGSRAVWNRMAAENVDAVLLIGDTPYIDSTTVEKQTKRHQEFAAVPEYQQLLRARPCWWTWDDHDFGGNDSTGLLPGKENSRLVYCRYRPQREYGDGEGGIYTSFRYGPVEIFVLDARWYSMTAASFAAPAQPTLLGNNQWEWLKKRLLASTAPFKFLASGMIWDDKENREKDDWGTYIHERNALEKFIQTNRIPGVALLGGDIHASRVLKYPAASSVGYDLVQFIASPVHGNTIPSLNVYNPSLVRSAIEPNVFLVLEADTTVTPAHLGATLINADGERVFTYAMTTDHLQPKNRA